MKLESYLFDPAFDQSKHFAPNKTMTLDDRIMEDKRGGRDAVTLYSVLKDTIGLSEHKYKIEKDVTFVDENGKCYCVCPQKTVELAFRIKRTKYYQHKELLKDAGLIQYESQLVKKEGFANRIYLTQWEDWVKVNGLYSYGKWIVQPSSPNFYNPEHIVKVQPTISTVEPVERDPSEEQPAQPALTSYEEELHAKVFVKHEMPDGIDTVVSKQSKAKVAKYVQNRHSIERNQKEVWLIEIDADKNKKESNLSELNPLRDYEYLVARADTLGYEVIPIEVD